MKEKNKPKIGLARQIARKLLDDAGIKNPPILINDVVKHIKKDRELSVYPWTFGDNTDGIQVTQGDSSTIGYNANQHPHRQRFTVAHEIGHMLLGHTSKSPVFDLKSKNPEEVEANQFAAELLMPLKMIKAHFQEGIKDAKKLSGIYNVSEEAIWWRLYECKII